VNSRTVNPPGEQWRTKIELSIAIAEWIEHFYNPERSTARSATFRPRSSKHSTPYPSRPDSYKAGPGNGVKASEQPQRDSNPCRHLERVVS
jgi:hypothetical protein